jgi:tripartite-type tricarboxylate transporter receptor subunit TctC
MAGNGPEGYPQRPVNIIVPFAPGGGSDNVARLLAARLSERSGATFIIDNKPGAGTNIGNEQAARAKNDGYTLLLGQTTLSINPSVYKALKYDSKKDFVAVAHLATSPTLLIATPGLAAKNVQELIALAKAKPDAINYGSGGKGTSVHLAGELFSTLAAAPMTHVPYKGSAPAVTDLIGGQIQLMFDTAPSALPHVKGGKVRPLAVTGSKRLSDLLHTPTFAEAGLPGFDAPAWYGLLAPAGTATAVVKYLNDEIEQILKEPATQQKLMQMGAMPVGGTPESFARFMNAEAERWSAVVKKAGVTAD